MIRSTLMPLLCWYFIVQLIQPGAAIKTCMATQHDGQVGQCSIMKDNPLAMAKPSYQGDHVPSNGCAGDPNSNIHVLAMTDQPSDDSLVRSMDDPGNVTVRVTCLDQCGQRPIILVLATVTPVQWIVTIDEGITLETIIWSSMRFYPGMSFQIDPASHQKPPIYLEILPDRVANIGDGTPFNPMWDERDHTKEFLGYVRETYGSDVGSFTGTHFKVDKWSLTIKGDPKREVEEGISKNEVVREKLSGNEERQFYETSIRRIQKETRIIIFSQTYIDGSYIAVVFMLVILLLVVLKW